MSAISNNTSITADVNISRLAILGNRYLLRYSRLVSLYFCLKLKFNVSTYSFIFIWKIEGYYILR